MNVKFSFSLSNQVDMAFEGAKYPAADAGLGVRSLLAAELRTSASPVCGDRRSFLSCAADGDAARVCSQFLFSLSGLSGQGVLFDSVARFGELRDSASDAERPLTNRPSRLRSGR